MIKLKGHKVLSGKIKVVTGLHIGGEKAGLQIGGVDNPVIKTVDGLPYIPGSSLKGKIRSLLEQKYESYNKKGEPTLIEGDEKSLLISALFGFPAKLENKEDKKFPGCLIFRDAHYAGGETKDDLFETKPENFVDRIKGTAKNPRFTERVVAGTEFDIEIVFREFDYGDEYPQITKEKLKNMLKEGLELLEKDYLGGSGTRGYGKIEFIGLKEAVESL